MKNGKLYLLLVYTIAASASPSPSCLNISEHPDLKKALDDGWHIETISAPSITENGSAIKVSINVSLCEKPPLDLVNEYSDVVKELASKAIEYYKTQLDDLMREPTEEEIAQEEAERKEREETHKKWAAEFKQKKERFQKGELTQEEINEILSGFFDPIPTSFASKAEEPVADTSEKKASTKKTTKTKK